MRKNKPGAGRPRVYSTELPVYDSMEQCANATKVPLEVLKKAKKGGCLFVRHGRVHFSEFIEWIFNQDPDSTGEMDWAVREKRAAALIKENSLERLRGKSYDSGKVDSFLRSLVRSTFFGELDRIKSEFPPGLKGKGEIAIEAEVEKQIESIKRALNKQLDAWEAEKKNE